MSGTWQGQVPNRFEMLLSYALSGIPLRRQACSALRESMTHVSSSDGEITIASFVIPSTVLPGRQRVCFPALVPGG
ncbi:MAG: hypothetical protein Fues2KO_08190 [Fuerstiella sp.]